jgi:hypothetical protein
MSALSEEAFPMPSLDHIHYTEYENFYEPAEDTFLLIDALTKVLFILMYCVDMILALLT